MLGPAVWAIFTLSLTSAEMHLGTVKHGSQASTAGIRFVPALCASMKDMETVRFQITVVKSHAATFTASGSYAHSMTLLTGKKLF